MSDLTELENKLKAVYKQAADETREKANKFFAKFTKQDQAMQKAVKDGKITQDEYLKWRQVQMLTGRNYRALVKELAKDMVNANQIAASIVNGYTPGAYADGMNFATYQIEKDIAISTAFALYDRMTVERLMREDPDIIPWKAEIDVQKDMLWNKQKINAAITQSILQGESIPHTADRLKKIAAMNNVQATRTARTAMTAAENAGRIDSYNRAKGMGIRLKKQWLATMDDRVRDSHAWLDGMSIPINDTFPNGCDYPGDPGGAPEEVYNCFLADTKIASDSEIVRSYKHKYTGKIISIKTAGGVQFSCTPNHPILTPRGWVAAELLKNGDDILVTFGMDYELSRRNPNINHAFPCMKAIHELFRKFGSQRACNLCVNFHGDVPTSDVEIVTQKRLLRESRYASIGNGFKELWLKRANSFRSGQSHFMKRIWSVRKSSLCNVRRKRKSFSLIWRRLRHSQIHCLRPVALIDPCGVQPLNNNASGNAELLRECLDGFSGIVFADNIVSVNIRSGSTHVYNLQTQNGYYFVNSIIPQNMRKVNGIFAIAHNCRCSLIADIEGVDQGRIDDATLRPSEKLQRMTYDDWKDEHKKPSWMR